MRGAGGTDGGTASYVVGLLMAMAGAYLLLQNIVVSHAFSLSTALFHVPLGRGVGWGVPSGALLVPFMAGVGLVFYSARSVWGWLLAGGSLAALVLGVILSLRVSLRSMSLLELVVILVLLTGGLGLFARALMPAKRV